MSAGCDETREAIRQEMLDYARRKGWLGNVLSVISDGYQMDPLMKIQYKNKKSPILFRWSEVRNNRPSPIRSTG